jgi:hypothetical protein
VQRLAARVVEKRIRSTVLGSMPTVAAIQDGEPVNIVVDTAPILQAEADALISAVDRGDWLRVVAACPIRETPALHEIAKYVGLPDRYSYEAGVLQALREDAELLKFVRGLFGELTTALGFES